jgi:DNA-binding transcriptional regulator YiaG
MIVATMATTKPPSAREIRTTREAADLTQAQAAALVYATERTWQNWESEGDEGRPMHPGLYELFKLKVAAARKPAKKGRKKSTPR